jgi:tetratricopeptide (TPR) repeat protein
LLHCQRGTISLRRRHFDDALVELDAAAVLLPHANPRDQCVILLNRGTTHMYRGDLRRARADLTRAADQARLIGDDVREFKARNNLGYVRFLDGDLPTALALLEDARVLAHAMSPALALLDRARVLSESGLVREADRTLATAALAFKADGGGQELAETLVERAQCALVIGDMDAARKHAAAARARFRRRGNERWRRTAELVLLQADLAAGRRGTRITASAQRLHAELDADGLRLPARTAALLTAEAQLSAGRTTEAVATLQTLPPSRRNDPITARLHGRYVTASVAAARGDRRVATATVRRGLRELAEYQARFGSIDLRTASAVHGRGLAVVGLGLAMDRGPAAVFDVVEQARAISTRLPPVRPPSDPRTAELIAELRQTVETLRAAEQDRAAIGPLQRRRHELEREISARRWTLPGSGEARRPARLTEVRAELAVREATLITFVRPGGMLNAVVVGSDRTRMQPLGPTTVVDEQIRRARADLDALANPMLPGPLRAAVRASFAHTMATLDEILLRPLGVDGRVVLATTGELVQLPWCALPSLRGVPVIITPSATAWLAARTAPPNTSRSVVAIAGPDLERAGDEVKTIAAQLGATALTDTDATRAALADAMSHAAIVHVAAHGTHQMENPLFSSLLLADGPLFAHELDTTARTADHVVLSACELGLATIRPGDEALGLTSVLLQLGTRSVISGVARVRDDLAAKTMSAYYRHLAGGADSAAALASALAEDDEPAPFVCFGSSWSATH